MNCSICEKALQQDILSSNLNEKTFLHFLNVVDKSHYNEAKKKGSFGFTIPVKGVPFSNETSYEQFDEWRDSYFEKKKFTESKELSLQYLRIETKERGYDSFDKCIQKCMNVPGLYAYIIDSDEDSFKIQVDYIADTEATGPIRINSSPIDNGTYNGNTDLLQQGTDIKPGHSQIYLINRVDIKKPSGGIINAGIGKRTSYKVEPWKESEVAPRPKTVVASIDSFKFKAVYPGHKLNLKMKADVLVDRDGSFIKKEYNGHKIVMNNAKRVLEDVTTSGAYNIGASIGVPIEADDDRLSITFGICGEVGFMEGGGKLTSNWVSFGINDDLTYLGNYEETRNIRAYYHNELVMDGEIKYTVRIA